MLWVKITIFKPHPNPYSMKSYLFLLFALCGASYCTSLSAQTPFGDRLVSHVGFSLTALDMTSTQAQFPGVGRYAFYALGVGTYGLIAHHNDRYSLGLNPNFQAGLQGFNGAIDWTLQAPIYLMGRFGAYCTPYNTQRLGLGAGVGFLPAYFSINSINSANQGQGLSQLYIAPALLLEASIAFPNGPITARVSLPLQNPTYEGVITDPGIFRTTATYKQLVFSIVYVFTRRN